jgi:MYXO-CTERM domain-containing protein
LTNLKGMAPIVAIAAASQGTVLTSLELYVDGRKVEMVTHPDSPVVLDWDTRKVQDGPHELSVRATDAIGTQGNSTAVEIWVDNKGACGCSSDGGGWEALGLLGLLAAIRSSARRPDAGPRPRES